MRLAKGSTCHAVEQNVARVENIKINAENLGAPNLKIHHGEIKHFVEKLPQPDAIFIGGGLTLELFNLAYEKLAIGGRLVINVISLRGAACLTQIYNDFADNLTQLRQISMQQITTANQMTIGNLQAFKPNFTVTQLALIKTKFAEENAQ